MDENRELSIAWNFVEHTGKSVFLTGKAGTGKTTFLKRVVQESTKHLVVLAPTGVAAINAGGTTIHSFFQLPLSPFVPDAIIRKKYNFSRAKRRLMNSLDLLVIDEISMVRSDVLDAVDYTLKRYRGNSKPFGGVQLLLIGDLQQLTPVVKPAEEAILFSYYTTPYFFGSAALSKVDYVTIELHQVFRQQEGPFLEVLNHIRDGKTTAADFDLLNSRFRPDFEPKAKEGYIRLTTHNHLADNYNESELRKLSTSRRVYKADVNGTFPENSFPTGLQLELREGAQVMFVKNDTSPLHRFYNGRIGHVEQVERDFVLVKCPGDENPIAVEPFTWENTTYELNEKTKEIEPHVLGTFTQLPLRLAWAITIHKSQGLTFDKAIIEADAAFASGQVYVALSRCRALKGLILSAPVSPRTIIRDHRVADYISLQHVASVQNIQALPHFVETYFRELLLELFNFESLIRAENRIHRLLHEFFSRKNREILQSHENLLTEFQTDVETVAHKWSSSISAMSAEQIHEDLFLERVKRGCTYFLEHISSILEGPIDKLKKIGSTNHEALKRLKDAGDELRLRFLFKKHLLFFIATHGFSLQKYLKYKQRATLLAMDGKEDCEENQFSAVEEPAKDLKLKAKKKKRSKEDTKKVSFKMFSTGMKIKEIAEERGLKPTTILNHLIYYVHEGSLSLNELVSPEHARIILEVYNRCLANPERNLEEKNYRFGVSLALVKSLCPSSFTYEEIRAALEFAH